MKLAVGTIVKVVHGKGGRFTTLRAKARVVFGYIKMGTFVGLVTFVAFQVGTAQNSTIVVRNTIVDAPKQSMAAVLGRIADCESGNGKAGSGKQFSNERLVVNTNTNGTVDVGKYQINLSAEHVREMAKLGFNPLTEEGNEAYAKYLYENRGTGDWSSSAHCWMR